MPASAATPSAMPASAALPTTVSAPAAPAMPLPPPGHADLGPACHLARKTGLRAVDKLGTDFMPEPPDDAAIAPSATQTCQDQRERVRHVHSFGMQPHAAIGNVGNPAITWQRAGAELDLGKAADGMALGPAPFFGFCARLELQHAHLAIAPAGLRRPPSRFRSSKPLRRG